MAWSKVSETTFVLSGASGVKTVNLPGSPAEDDIVLLMLACDNPQALDPTSGNYTAFYDSYDGSGPARYSGYKIMGASPDASVDIDYTTGTLVAGLIQIWRGIDTASPIDAAIGVVVNGSPGMPDPPTRTTINNGALRIIFGWLDDDDTAGTVTAPSGFSNVLAGDTGQASTTVGCTVMVASKEEATAGALDPDAFGGSGSDAWFAGHLSLKAGSGAYTIAADAGSYAVTGTAASLEFGRLVAAAAGSYAVTGSAATLRRALPLATDAGSYAITGSTASLEFGRVVAAEAGAYAVTGSAATLQRALPLATDAGSYALTGQTASLELGRLIAADAGAYAITGADATLTYAPVGGSTYTLAADAGSYAVTGSAAALEFGRLVSAEAGSYALTGAAANLTYAPPGVEEETPVNPLLGGGPGGGKRARRLRRKFEEEFLPFQRMLPLDDGSPVYRVKGLPEQPVPVVKTETTPPPAAPLPSRETIAAIVKAMVKPVKLPPVVVEEPEFDEVEMDTDLVEFVARLYG